MDEEQPQRSQAQTVSGDAAQGAPAPRPALTPAARRALDEAQARRKAIDAREAAMPKEIDGRGGRDPARFGDWEVKGLAIDF